MSDPKFRLGYKVLGQFINDFGDVIFSKTGSITCIWQKWQFNGTDIIDVDDYLYRIDDCESIFPEYLVQVAPLEIEHIKQPCPTCGKPQEEHI